MEERKLAPLSEVVERTFRSVLDIDRSNNRLGAELNDRKEE